MPTIKRFANCEIRIYPNDHLPPHFHIRGPEIDAMIAIATLGVMEGSVRKADDAMDWAAAHRAELMDAWNRNTRRR